MFFIYQKQNTEVWIRKIKLQTFTVIYKPFKQKKYDLENFYSYLEIF